MVDIGGQAAPALSSYQDESTFSFQQYEGQESRRAHLSRVPIKSHSELVEALTSYYSIPETVDFLNSEGLKYHRVTLQFPDELVCDASLVAQMIQAQLAQPEVCEEVEVSSSGEKCGKCDCKTPTADQKRSVWILADTSYSSCCVDEVAAEHVSSDLVIHYGDACLNPVKKVGVAYVFGQPKTDLEDIKAKIRHRYGNKEAKIVLMADSPHAYLLQTLHSKLQQEFPNMTYADLSLKAFPDARIIGAQPINSGTAHFLNRCFNGIESDDDSISDLLSDYELFHITVPEAPRLLQLTTIFQSVTLYNEKEQKNFEGPFPNLRRRYRYMHEARAAGTVGILVNTLSIANTRTVIEGLKKRIKAADRKHYVFVVGKPNVAKLANFEEIDIWCILGCDHQGIILDNDYYKPIVTPFELLGAFADEVTWNNKFETSFNKLEKELERLAIDDEDTPQPKDLSEDLPPQFNVVTGQYVSNSRPLREVQYLKAAESSAATDSDALVQKLSSEVAIGSTVSTAAIFLQNRTWRGLGSDFDENRSHEGSKVEEGIDGVARGYGYDVGK